MNLNNRKSNKDSSSFLNWCRGPASAGRPTALTFGLVWIIIVGFSFMQWELPARAEFFSTRSVKFMEGEWISHDKENDEIAQEIWSSTQGNSMAGETKKFEFEYHKEKLLIKTGANDGQVGDFDSHMRKEKHK